MRAHSLMFTATTNFFARHAIVVMPKAIRKTPETARPQFDYPLPYGALVREGGVQFVV